MMEKSFINPNIKVEEGEVPKIAVQKEFDKLKAENRTLLLQLANVSTNREQLQAEMDLLVNKWKQSNLAANAEIIIERAQDNARARKDSSIIIVPEGQE